MVPLLQVVQVVLLQVDHKEVRILATEVRPRHLELTPATLVIRPRALLPLMAASPLMAPSLPPTLPIKEAPSPLNSREHLRR